MASSPPLGSLLTCDPAAKEFQPEGNARVPGLWADPDEPGQQRAMELVQNHLCGITVGLKHLHHETQEWVTKSCWQDCQVSTVGKF